MSSITPKANFYNESSSLLNSLPKDKGKEGDLITGISSLLHDAKFITAPNTLYGRIVQYCFGASTNKKIAETIQRDLEKKYGAAVANFVFSEADRKHVERHGLNVFEGRQIYAVADQVATHQAQQLELEKTKQSDEASSIPITTSERITAKLQTHFEEKFLVEKKDCEETFYPRVTRESIAEILNDPKNQEALSTYGASDQLVASIEKEIKSFPGFKSPQSDAKNEWMDSLWNWRNSDQRNSDHLVLAKMVAEALPTITPRTLENFRKLDKAFSEYKTFFHPITVDPKTGINPQHAWFEKKYGTALMEKLYHNMDWSSDPKGQYGQIISFSSFFKVTQQADAYQALDQARSASLNKALLTIQEALPKELVAPDKPSPLAEKSTRLPSSLIYTHNLVTAPAFATASPKKLQTFKNYIQGVAENLARLATKAVNIKEQAIADRKTVQDPKELNKKIQQADELLSAIQQASKNFAAFEDTSFRELSSPTNANPQASTLERRLGLGGNIEQAYLNAVFTADRRLTELLHPTHT